MENQVVKLGYSVEETAKMTTLSKAFLRNQIRAGKLKARRVSRRVITLPEDLNDYLAASEIWKPKAER